MNGKKWDSLTPEQQKWITEAVKAATAEERKVVIASLAKYKKKVIADGGVVNKIDKAPFIAIATPIQDELAKKLNLMPLLQEIRALGK